MVDLVRSPVGVSIRECARQLNISDTAIRKAIAAGRCAKLPDGSVDVESVRAGMAATADPFRGGQRHAGVMGELPMGTVVTSNTTAVVPESAATATPASTETPEQQRQTSHRPLLEARTLSEQARAEREQIELAKLKGTLGEIAPMVRAVHDANVSARSELASLPDRLTPLVTPETDPAKVYSLIEAEVQRVCQTLQAKLQQMAAEHSLVTA